LIEFGQGYVSIGPPCKRWGGGAGSEDSPRRTSDPALANRQLRGGNGPGRQPQITKKRSTGHVDGVVALLMAMGATTLKKEKAKEYQMIII
jgi:hypothetical protein